MDYPVQTKRPNKMKPLTTSNLRVADDPYVMEALTIWDAVNTNWDDALARGTEFCSRLRATRHHRAYAWAALCCGRVAAYRGDFDLAEIALTEALGRFEFACDEYGANLAFLFLSIPEAHRGSVDRAVGFALRPLSSNVAYTDEDRSLLHNVLAMCYWRRGEIHDALTHVLKEHDLARRIGSSAVTARVVANLAVLLEHVGELELSLAASKKALSLQADGRESQIALRTNVLSNIVYVNYLLSVRSEALRYANLLHSLLGGSRITHHWRHYSNLANVYCLNGYVERGMECLEVAKAICPTPKDSFQLTVCDAAVLEARGEYRAAMTEGVLLWNKAFERIGFKDAIVVKQMPDSADWDPADSRS